MTIVRGSREIQIHYFGRAHTGGDIVILLPREKVVYTGDMMLYGPSFLADGYVHEWVTTLQNLKSIDFEIILPGHGSPFKGRERIGYVQAYYTDPWDQVAAMHAKGMSVEETDHWRRRFQFLSFSLCDLKSVSFNGKPRYTRRGTDAPTVRAVTHAGALKFTCDAVLNCAAIASTFAFGSLIVAPNCTSWSI